MNHTTGRLLAAALLLTPFLLLAALPGRPPEARAGEEAVPAARDPFPILRVLLPPDRLVEELRRAGEGALVRLPRAAFEEKVRRAARVAAAERNAPRLVEARYRARLEGDNLLGSAEWKLIHPGAGAGALDLEPLGLAVRQGRWEDGAPLLIGPFPPGPPPEAPAPGGPPAPEAPAQRLKLLVPEPGPRSLTLDWSARGVPEPDELRFSLGVPPSPIASLEVELPADRALSAPHADCLLQGPLPSDLPGHRLWRVAFGGRSELSLAVYRQSGPGRPRPLILSRAQSSQELTPGLLRCRFEVDLEVLRGWVQELTLECDPSLQPYEVVVNNRESWGVEPPQRPGGPKRIRVSTRDLFQGGRVVVLALAPLRTGPGEAAWASPGLRVAGALGQGETIQLRLHPDLHLADFTPGDYRVTQGRQEPDGFQALTLEPVPLPAAEPARPRRRPAARVELLGPEFAARQSGEWRIDPGGSALDVRLVCEVLRGSLERLEIPLPAGWEVERVGLGPAGAPADWGARGGRAPALRIDLPRAVSAGGSVECVLRLRAPAPDPGTVAELDLPDLTPPGAARREGSLVVRVNPAFEAFATPVGSTALVDSAAGRALLAGGPAFAVAPAEGVYAFAGRGFPVQGRLRLRPRVGRLRARAESRVFLRDGGLWVQARLHLRPVTGAVAAFPLLTTAPARGLEGLYCAEGANQVEEVSPWPGGAAAAFANFLAARGPLDGAARCAAARDSAHPGVWWLVTMARPVQEPLVLAGEYEAVPPLGAAGPAALVAGAGPFARPPAPRGDLFAAADRRPVPLVRFPAAEPEPAEVTLDLPSAGVEVEATGFDERPAADGPGRRLRASGEGGCSLALVPPGSGRSGTGGSERGAGRIDSARLTTYLRAEGDLLCHFCFRLRGNGWRHVPLTLPAGAEPLAVAVAGHWSAPPNWSLAGAGAGVGCVIAVDPNLRGQIVEVVYRLPRRPGWLTERPESPAPLLPAPPPVLHRVWKLPADLALIGAHGLAPQPDPSPASSPELSDVPGDEPAAPREGEEPPSVLAEGLREVTAAGWQGWETWEGPDSPGSVRVAHTGRARWLGWAVAALSVVLAGALSGRRWRGKWRLLFVWLFAAGMAYLWLPGPLRGAALPVAAAAVGTAAVAVLLRSRRGANGRGVPAGAAPAAAAGDRKSQRLAPTASLARPLGVLVLGALACALAARAQEPPPAVVFLVPPSPDEPEPREVFAPRELLERLERLARDPVPDVFLTDAVYEGRVAGDAALFEARFGVYCLGDGPAVLRLPLAGVRLREALLDGAAAYPRPGRGANGEGAAEDDYEFDLRGAGKHTLRLRFAVPVAGAGADREVRFQIPELVQSRLELESAAELPQLDVVNWRGARRLAAPGGGPVRLEADLGRSRVVHLRWRGRDPGDGAVVQARELLGLWELAPASARLWSVAHFRISQGSVAALRLAIPEELVIARLGVHPLDNPAGGVPAEWVKAWRLSDPAGGKKAGAGGYRSLTVELVAPVTGDVRVTLELVPREPLTARPVLRFPAAIPGTAAGETYVAVRSAGLAAAPAIEAEGAADYPAAAFLKEHWEPAQFTKLPAAPARAFRAERGQRPVLRPVLEPQPRGSRVEQELTWSLGEAVAVRAAMKWASPADDLLLLEWDVPEAVEVREVRGERLRSWSRDGTRVQAWLRAPAREASLEWFGSLARPARKRPPAREVVRLPAVRPRDADVRTALTVVPQPGWAVVPERLEGLRERPAAPGARALAFETTGPEPRSAFAVYPPRAPLPVRVEQRAAVEGRSLVFRAEVTAGLPGKRPHALTVACVPAPHDGALTRPVLSLEAPPGCRVSEEPGPDGGRAWTVDVPPVGPGEPPAAGKGRAVRVAVTGRLPLAGGVEWSVPRVRVSCGGEVIEPRSYRLRLGGPGLRVLAAEGLRERGKVAWEAAGRDWSLRVRASPIRLAGGPSAKAFTCDVQVAPVGPRWACRAAIDLYHDAGTDLALRLPPGARLEALAVDGVPTDAGGREVRGPVPIPAPPGPGLRLVQALWTCAAEGDALRPPVLLAGGETVALPEVLWTTLPPVGRREDAPQAGSPARPLSAAERDLLRAEALLRALELLAPGPVTGGGERDAARSTLARCVERLRAAERRLSGGDTLPGGTGPLRDRLDRAGDELRRLSRALDAAAGEDRPTRSTAPPGEERTWSEMPFVHAFARGAPVRTRGAPLPLAAAAAPPAAPAGTDRPTLIRSAVLTALTALLLALSALTGPRTRPEQFALVGGIAAAVFPSPEGLLFLALPVLALAYRLLGLAARAGRLLLARA